jgi:enoyl-[acyl-carrier protein] reductase I
VCGIANEHSIAYGCAKASRSSAPRLAITYLNDKARPVRRADRPGAGGADLHAARRVEAGRTGGGVRAHRADLGAARHPRALAGLGAEDDLQGGLLDCSAQGFGQAMDVSCHSFIRMARLAAPLMKDGGTLFTMSYHGANKVVRTTT